MPGLMAKEKSNMATLEKADGDNYKESNDYSDKENSEISHFVRRSTRRSSKPEFLSPSFTSELRKGKDSVQVASYNSSPKYSSDKSEYDIDDKRLRGESMEAFSKCETSFRKPPARGRKRKSLSQGKEEAKKLKIGSSEKRIIPTEDHLSTKDDEEQSLFDIVKGGKTALRAVLDDWIETYNEDREGAMVDLVQFVVQCCGCKGKVTRQMIEAEETVKAIRQLTETFDEESHEYPLIATGPASKKFKSNLSHFIEILIMQCQHSVVYDEVMMDTFISWLIGLSDSQVRAFRHTSTFAGLKVVSALIEVAKNVSIESDNTQRQLDSESRKPTGKRSREKVEVLQRRREEVNLNALPLYDLWCNKMVAL